MAKLGTLFGVVAAVLAIAAAVLSFMIHQKRVMYEQRTGELASAVARMVQNMDPNSTSGIAANVSYTPADPDSGEAESGTLSWASYMENPSDYESAVGQAVSLAGTVNRQRDQLAESLSKVGSELQMPDTDLDPAMLRNLGNIRQFTEATESIMGHVNAVASRDQAMINAIERASQALEQPVDTVALTRREETTDEDGNVVKGPFPYGTALDEFTGNVQGVVRRADEYANAIVEAINRVTMHDWSVNSGKIKDQREYVGALTSLQNDFDDINEQLALYEQAKKEVADQKKRISQLTEANEEMDSRIAEMTRDLARAQTQLKRYKVSLPGSDFGDGTLDPDLTGQILHVNDQWDFVIVDVGRRNNVQENLKMLVAREDKLVAKLQLSRVLGKVSVGEILPEAMAGSVKVGDRVILPKTQD